MTNPHDKAIEAAAKVVDPDLFSDDPVVAHRAASPFTVEAARKLVIDNLTRAIAAYERAMWRPIEEAPRESDGEDVIVVGGRYAEPTVVSSDGAWWALQKSDGSVVIPTHFRPLPSVPEGE